MIQESNNDFKNKIITILERNNINYKITPEGDIRISWCGCVYYIDPTLTRPVDLEYIAAWVHHELKLNSFYNHSQCTWLYDLLNLIGKMRYSK